MPARVLAQIFLQIMHMRGIYYAQFFEFLRAFISRILSRLTTSQLLRDAMRKLLPWNLGLCENWERASSSSSLAAAHLFCETKSSDRRGGRRTTSAAIQCTRDQSISDGSSGLSSFLPPSRGRVADGVDGRDETTAAAVTFVCRATRDIASNQRGRRTAGRPVCRIDRRRARAHSAAAACALRETRRIRNDDAFARRE